ncbi:Glutamyl-tRNA reductase [Candidatus Magnetomoraceae bacterium gMMP-13]
MNIVVIGLNHKTAPVEVRECLSFSEEDIDIAVESLKTKAISEVILISTCNRIEILLTTENQNDAITQIKNFLCSFGNISLNEFDSSLYIHEEDDAVKHIFRVASSLDSMILGEPQILGQMKDAYKLATVKKTSGVILNRLLHRTFFVAKRVRSETGIGDHAVSISYAAIELGRKIFGSLEDKKVLLIGAGEMAELAIEHLIRHKSGLIFVANRTLERGIELADRFKGTAISFEEIENYLKEVDIIISSTGAPSFVLNREHVKKAMKARKNSPLFLIDIAVPRDIDPEINRLSNAYVYDIDDLKGVIDENIEERNQEAVKAERIIDEAVIRFREWRESLNIVPTIKDLKKKMEDIARGEIKKTINALSHANEEDYKALERMSHAMINKFLHDPILFLRGNGSHGEMNDYIDITRKLFNLR